MTSKPLDIDGNVMQVGDLVVLVRSDYPENNGKYLHVERILLARLQGRTGVIHPANWFFISKDCQPFDACACEHTRIIRDTKAKENIDLAEWVGEREEVK